MNYSCKKYELNPLQVGDVFVLNCLGEDDYAGTMRHFLKRFAPGMKGMNVGVNFHTYPVPGRLYRDHGAFSFG